MVITTYRITSYQIILGGEHRISDGERSYKFPAFIHCRSDNADHLIFTFFHDGDPRPKPLYDPERKWATQRAWFKDIMAFTDTLRNEKPIFAYVNSERPEHNSLSTGAEQVGEGEIDQ